LGVTTEALAGILADAAALAEAALVG
jgi:hypothetical protein